MSGKVEIFDCQGNVSAVIYVLVNGTVVKKGDTESANAFLKQLQSLPTND